MDDLRNKTDSELQNIMRGAVSNQHVPSSIYHRAKQELEFRANAVHKDLSQMERSVLRAIANSKQGTDATGKFIHIETLEHQFGARHMPQVKEALHQLKQRHYVDGMEDYDYDEVFRITPFGTDYLADSATPSITTYSNITNSNVAHNSQHVQQSINILDLPEDIQQAVKELNNAAAERDSSKMKKTFAYIADKAVDVAIAIALGQLKY